MKRKLFSLFIAALCCISTWATEGALLGRFTINANGDQIVFSQGNLQYKDGTGWRFAEHQWDFIGAWGTSDWVDLFGWGTWGEGQNPLNTSTTDGDYSWSSDFSGTLINATSEGWYTPSTDIFEYILNTRSTNSGIRYVKAKVNDFEGVILLPDNWNSSIYALNNANTYYAWYESTIISLSDWTDKFEANGAVFIPRASMRDGASAGPGGDGHYWTTTPGYAMHITNSDLSSSYGYCYKYYGFSVRLVRAADPEEPYVLQQDEDGNYLLSTVQDMLAFAALVNDGNNTANAKVLTDIDLAGNEDNQWTPIGTESHKYKGTFDGHGYAIKNLYWHGNNQLNIGFFGYVDGAKIMNLRLEDADIYNPGQDGTTGKFVGGMVGHSSNGNTLVINCSFSGSVTGMLEVGSMIGGGPAKVINCYNEGTVTFTSQTHYAAGGILGYNSNGITINNCYNVGDVINNGNPTDYMGAICYHGVTNSYYRENCCQNGSTAGWSNQGPGTVMSLDNMKTVVFVATLNANVASLQATYPDISEWVQDPVTNLPILKIFAKAHDLVENQLEQDEEGNYLLGSVQDWQDFATLVQTTPTAKAKMTADINLGDDQTMVGTDAVPYAGIFDGQGHTLTVNYNIYSVETAVAPFACVNGATILNLHVAGSIQQRRCAAGGVVGSVNGNLTVKKCWVSATLTVDGEGNYQGTIGGIASCCDNSSVQGKSIRLEDCLFSGYVATGIHCGGLMSHVHGESYNNSAAFNNCLNIGTCNGPSGSTGTFIRTGVQGDPYTITNCYYKTAWRVAQGAQATETELADGTTTAALQNSREEEIWVQEGEMPMLKIFVSEGSDPVEPDAWENGALSGKFSINANGDKIVFSQGNLQYFCSTTAPEWRFAEHQYDFVPFDMSAYAANSEKWIDLFAYGTSGYDNGQTNYQPYVVGADPNTYYQGNLVGNADWGYNAISNGGNTENIGWRTPTSDEWIYLFSGRTNAASKYGHGSINGVNGMILLPDKWTTPDGLSFTPGNSVWQNAYTIEQWALMEEAGAVFLQASGSCNNVGIPNESLQNQNGFYRASTAAYYVYIGKSRLDICTMSFYQYGDAVRLVHAAPADPVEPCSLEQDEEGYYLLGSVQDWKEFAALVNGGNITANAKMTADIDLGDDQTMVGIESVYYQGIFDGQGHTLTVHYVAEADVTAPFRFIQQATIKNLRVDGTITTAFHNAAGIVGSCFGQKIHSYIENCVSSVNIISSYVNTNGDFYGGAMHGGIAATLNYYGQLHITDCIFNGSISGENKGVVWGGMLGIPDGTATFYNCLQIGTFDCSNVIGGYNGSGTISTVFGTGYASQVYTYNCHYLNALGNAQGIQATAEQLADGTTTTALNAGRTGDGAVWVQNGSTPMLKIFASTDPGPATSIDNTNANANAVKCIINGQILILRGDKIYNVVGTVVR